MHAALCAILLLPSLSLAQGTEAPTKQDKKPVRAKKQTPPKWPKLKFVRKSLARENIAKLGGKHVEKARKLILSYGAGVCPVLLDALHARQKPAIAEQIERLLDELATPEYGQQLAAAYRGNHKRRNHYVVRRVAGFEKKDYLPFLKKVAKGKDAELAEISKFAMARLGDLEALPFLFELTKNQWAEKNYPVREATTALAGKPATDWLMKKLIENDQQTKVAALRLLGVAGTKSAVSAVGTYLNAKEHQLRAGAVNALRGIVDDDPPFRNLSVFQAIEEVKKWKQRIGR